MPYPFIFSPARKKLLNDLFPEKISDKNRINLIQGVSQAGKSNFACHLALMLRRKPFEYAVMYIGNMELFNESPIDYCKKELFYWFHEELKESLLAQILMGYALKSDLELKSFSYIMKMFSRICEQKKKTIYLIEDQFNNLKEDEEFDKVFKPISHYKILVSTNTDMKAPEAARQDAGSAFTFELDERNDPIKEPEIKKIIAQLFPGMLPDSVDLLCDLTETNLNLNFLFCNYCALKKISLPDENTLASEFETFSKKYIDDNKVLHRKWFDDELPSNGKQISVEMMKLIDSNQEISLEFELLYLDKRFIIAENRKIFSINPLISKMMREIYFTPNELEKILAQYGPSVGGSWAGSLFEYYILSTIKNLQKQSKHFSITIKDNHDNDQIFHIAPLSIKKMRHSHKFQKITLEGSDDMDSCFYIPIQQNFALIDSLNAEKKNPIRNIDGIRLKLNDNFKKDFLATFQKYYKIYKEQLLAFFGNSFHFFNN